MICYVHYSCFNCHSVDSLCVVDSLTVRLENDQNLRPAYIWALTVLCLDDIGNNLRRI